MLPTASIVPDAVKGPKRAITTEDLTRIRDIDVLSLSPDGSRFAILVRQADAAANTYRSSWFVGAVSGGTLVHAGDGGEARLLRTADGFAPSGDIAGGPVRWSPDGKWFAYPVLQDHEVQIWRSRSDGSAQQQMTRSAGDVREFAWSPDGRELLYSAGASRQELRDHEAQGLHDGFRLDEFYTFKDIVFPGVPSRRLDVGLTIRVVNADGSGDRLATDAERAAFGAAQQRGFLTTGAEANEDRSLPPAVRADGAAAWFVKVDEKEDGPAPHVRLVASLGPSRAHPVSCMARECVSQLFAGLWWRGNRLVFQRWEGINGNESGFYEWSPVSGRLRPVLKARDGRYLSCERAGERLICLREMPAQPRHVAALDLRSGRIEVLADVNPEFSRFELARVERVEWDLPSGTAHAGYPSRARGYVIYPPGFDRRNSYPIFIAPYATGGFLRGDVGNEHPLFVYAANGMVVINSEFPVENASLAYAAYDPVQTDYSPEQGFPKLTILMESTFRALETLSARGFIDARRVGIGGVSHGAFMPLWMMQKQDRIAAASVGGPNWSGIEPYLATRSGRTLLEEMGAGKGFPESPRFWSQIDLADHVGTIEAPILFHFAASESVFGPPRLIRRLDDAGLPYEAFIFKDEYHTKVQPAHIQAIYDRNLDWFRFWLQDYEDPSAAKKDQYVRWRQLRELQCKNPRSVRNYCRG